MGLLNPAAGHGQVARVGIRGQVRMRPKPGGQNPSSATHWLGLCGWEQPICGTGMTSLTPQGCGHDGRELQTGARHAAPSRGTPSPLQGPGAEAAMELGGYTLRWDQGHPQACTLKMPAMERVRLEVLETRRNSEKPKPKARIPPRKRLPSTRSSSPVSWKRKIFSDVDRWRPGSTGGRQREAVSWVGLLGGLTPPTSRRAGAVAATPPEHLQTGCGPEDKGGRGRWPHADGLTLGGLGTQ